MMAQISGDWQEKVRLKREAQAKALAAVANADVCVKKLFFFTMTTYLLGDFSSSSEELLSLIGTTASRN